PLCAPDPEASCPGHGAAPRAYRKSHASRWETAQSHRMCRLQGLPLRIRPERQRQIPPGHTLADPSEILPLELAITDGHQLTSSPALQRVESDHEASNCKRQCEACLALHC